MARLDVKVMMQDALSLAESFCYDPSCENCTDGSIGVDCPEDCASHSANRILEQLEWLNE